MISFSVFRISSTKKEGRAHRAHLEGEGDPEPAGGHGGGRGEEGPLKYLLSSNFLFRKAFVFSINILFILHFM